MKAMQNRAAFHEEFMGRFCINDPSPVTDQQLDAIEAELETKLPCAYREFMSRHGAGSCPKLLDEIADAGLEFPDVREFLDPVAAIENTKNYWAAGMPGEVIGIASDCMGNMIGFRRQVGRTDDSPIIFFDHDYVEVKQIAVSFDELLSWYTEHL
jgi:hypothetical protein